MLAFTKLIEARAHARKNDAKAASKALKASEDLLGQAKDNSGDEPAWIDFYHHARLSADAAEIFRDLKNPKMALTWNQQAAAMPTRVITRSVGMRLAIVGTAYLRLARREFKCCTCRTFNAQPARKDTASVVETQGARSETHSPREGADAQ
ncbi:hypothetical protein [Streptomyces sp. RLB3-17]|uniref:hypothetical protein n=1 Tax=Streptomyces sp. RLB3-17 TaxID=2594455 RepID=UPI001CECE9ED|nr:hypothetical protein [Streptomyces sp. RLB3-17]